MPYRRDPMFRWVELRAFCHATEDEERVVAAIHTLLPEADADRQALEGHHGNPIVALTARTEKAREAEAFWRRIADGFGRDALLRDMEDRLDDDGVFHVRVDKQAAYQGSVVPATTDDVIAVRGKVAAFPNKPSVARDVLRRYLEAL